MYQEIKQEELARNQNLNYKQEIENYFKGQQSTKIAEVED